MAGEMGLSSMSLLLTILFCFFVVVVLRGNEVETVGYDYLSGGDGGNAEIREIRLSARAYKEWFTERQLDQ